MAPHDHVLVAEDDADVVGLLSLRIVSHLAEDTPHSEVAELFVAESHRRRGVGTALMREAERIARERGSREMHVRAWHTNDGARQFYERIGYRQLEVCFHNQLIGT